MSTPTPSVGRIVHYVSHGTPPNEYGEQAFPSECRAAIIAGVPKSLEKEPMDGCPNGTNGDWLVDLVVINPTGMFFNQRCELDEAEKLPGTCHWPERA